VTWSIRIKKPNTIAENAKIYIKPFLPCLIGTPFALRKKYQTKQRIMGSKNNNLNINACS
jgi:hypothetical protein